MWHRHRTWSFNEISRRYTEVDMEFYTPAKLRAQAKIDRQASVDTANFCSVKIIKKNAKNKTPNQPVAVFTITEA